MDLGDDHVSIVPQKKGADIDVPRQTDYPKYQILSWSKPNSKIISSNGQKQFTGTHRKGKIQRSIWKVYKEINLEWLVRFCRNMFEVLERGNQYYSCYYRTFNIWDLIRPLPSGSVNCNLEIETSPHINEIMKHSSA